MTNRGWWFLRVVALTLAAAAGACTRARPGDGLSSPSESTSASESESNGPDVGVPPAGSGDSLSSGAAAATGTAPTQSSASRGSTTDLNDGLSVDEPTDDNNPNRSGPSDGGITDASMVVGPAPQAGATTTADGLVAELCHVIINCPSFASDVMKLNAHFAREEQPLEVCIAGTSTNTWSYVYALAPELESGQLRVNDELLQRMVACEIPLRGASEIFIPNTPTGEQCRSHAQCVEGICDDSQCPRTCLPAVLPGGRCGSSEECGTGQCLDDQCLARQPAQYDLPLGAACSWSEYAPQYCGGGTWCSRAERCAMPLDPGEPCDILEAHCPGGYVCADDENGVAHCSRLRLLALGETCAERAIDTDGVYAVCNTLDAEVCTGGVCARAVPALENEGCNVDRGLPCADGLVCNSEVGTCQRRRSVGDECSNGWECACIGGRCVDTACSL